MGTLTSNTVAELRQIVSVLSAYTIGPDASVVSGLTYAAEAVGVVNPKDGHRPSPCGRDIARDSRAAIPGCNTLRDYQYGGEVTGPSRKAKMGGRPPAPAGVAAV